MRFPIEWHENCLNNQKTYLISLRNKEKFLAKEIENLKVKSEFYSLQIEKAKEKQLDGFDRDKFGIKRNTKEV